MKTLIYCLGAILLLILAWLYYDAQEKSAQVQMKITSDLLEEEQKTNRYNEFVKVANSIPKYVDVKINVDFLDLGGTSGGTITLANNSAFDFDNLVLQLEYVRAGGRVHKKELIETKRFNVSQIKKFNVPASNYGVELRYRFYSIQSFEFDLFHKY